MPDVGAFPTNMDIISAVNYEINNSTEVWKEKGIIKDTVINKFNEISSSVPLEVEESGSGSGKEYQKDERK